MVDKPAPTDVPPTAVPTAGAGADGATPPPAPRRPPGHRGADMRDTVAEMAERAQLISQEAGSKVAAAMKDVISAAAGIAGFAIESARDLVQYMVRRGQMTPEEAEKLMREAEAAHDKRPASEKSRPTASKIAAERAAAAKVEAAARAAARAAAQLAAAPLHRPIAPIRPAAPPAVAHPHPHPHPQSVPEKPVAAKTLPKASPKVAKTATAKSPAKTSAKAPKKAAKTATPKAPKAKAAPKKKSKR
jgi:polyhydroxyalkanoate synthesis regulator phasin